MSQITKQALANSLQNLLKKTPLDKITVKELVEDCGVNRQTFYYHFQDIYDLLDWVFTREAEDAIAENKTYETWQQGFLQAFRRMEERKSLIRNVYNSAGREHLERYLYQMVYDVLIDVIHELAKGRAVAEEDQRFIANFYKWAFVGLLLEWIQTGMKERPEMIMEQLAKLIAGDFQRALEKYEQK